MTIDPTLRGLRRCYHHYIIAFNSCYHDNRPDFKGIETHVILLPMYLAIMTQYHDNRPDFKGIETSLHPVGPSLVKLRQS